MNVISATKSNNTITVLVNDGGKIKPIPATSDHPKWADILAAWVKQDYDALLELLSLKRVFAKFSNGNLVVSDQGVFYRDVQVVGIDVDRIMAFLRNNEPFHPIANYMAKKFSNPSLRAITEMYNFLEHKNMPLTPNGTIIAYKGIKADFYSVSSGHEPLIQGKRHEDGTIFNGVGEVIEMDRSSVDNNFLVGCSQGLHAGSLAYARAWAHSHNGVIILIEIDPADVVSVPEDCGCRKLRCRKYKVIGLYDGPLPDTYTSDYSNPEDTTNHIHGPAVTILPQNSDLRIRFVALICEQVGCLPFSVEDPFSFTNDLGLDSLDQIELCMAVEEEFRIEIPDEIAEKCLTVGQAIEELSRLLEKNAIFVPPVSERPERNAPPNNSYNYNDYQQGYEIGLKNGVRRRRRLYFELEPVVNNFQRGYCAGYRAGRKDYKH